jgi:uroporphyrinogen-III synthase
MTAHPIALTRAPEDNAPLAARLRADGFGVVEWPAMTARVLHVSRDALLAAIARADRIVLTSRRGVEACLAHLGGLEPLHAKDVAAVGDATAEALRAEGIEPRWIGSTGAVALADRMAADGPSKDRVLLLRSAAADDALPERLRLDGFVVDDVRTYEPVAPPRPDAEPQPLGAVVCASPSAAGLVLEWFPWIKGERFVAIGPTTARALEALGVTHVTVAAGTDVDSLYEAVVTTVWGGQP